MLFQLFSIFSDWMLLFALHLSSSNFPPVLSAADEAECFDRMAAGDLHARDRLIKHNLRLVAHVTKKYYGGMTEQDDLISIGTIGLIKAVNTYNRSHNSRFATYAAKCIQNEVLMFLRKNIKSRNDAVLSDAIEPDSGGNSLTLFDLLFDDCDVGSEIETKETSAALKAALKCLSPRENKIIELRYGLSGSEPLTQNEVAALLDISRSYVSRLESKALCRLREQFEK